jgi:hypothetical protein
MDSLIADYVERLKTEIIAIPEDSGLFITEDKCVVVGENQVKVFPGGIEVIKDQAI